MINCEIKNWQGETVGEQTLELKTAKVENASHIVHRALVRQLAHARQGNASTKTRAEVRGGGRKPWRQKGTGRARAGSIRSPLWRGGGVTFGPKPRDYELKMNRKERKLALRTALDSRSVDIIVVENFSEQLPKPKTKELTSALTRWGVEGQPKVLMILSEIAENVALSARNISYLKMLKASNLNIQDLLTAGKIIITSEALAQIQELYQ
ncbi:50S ribosomal protein L4 [Gloeocapsa sp. PCC 73106]|uniref:50S ribosomal protein L4 n=1 Tax=Gloeocapsa sp. PCC 73106 TaxID=102232 RepID=UPI0002AC1E0F|nr:50S ribosomal protein L4 [Gloeocapsa sp. PCC 73106]ELR98835.1 50S ribosomal protein L4, bacterial/organelle [Gloeocapsa sp. PCC 73106]